MFNINIGCLEGTLYGDANRYDVDFWQMPVISGWTNDFLSTTNRETPMPLSGPSGASNSVLESVHEATFLLPVLRPMMGRK